MSNHHQNQSHYQHACNFHSTLSKPLHPKLDGVGVEVDIPNLIDRCKNGNRLEEGMHTTFWTPDTKTDERLGFSLFTLNVNPNEDIGSSYDIGQIQGAIDGIGLKYNAHAATLNSAIGPVDLGAKVGTAEAGAKLWQPGVGLDAGFKANASALEVNVGPVNGNIGVGFDTGVKVGKEGVGLEVLGTGIQIGRTTKISLFGSSFSFKF